MARNGSGTHSLPVGNPVVSGTPVSSSAMNDTLTDLSAEITDSLSRSGKGGMTAALAMGNNKITGLATPTLDTDAATKKYADDLYTQGTTTATLGTDWTDPVSGGINSVRKSAGVVTVSIYKAAGAASAWANFATLAAGYRPAAEIIAFGRVRDESASKEYFAQITISAAGAMTVGTYDNGAEAVAPFTIGAGDTVLVTATFAAA